MTADGEASATLVAVLAAMKFNGGQLAPPPSPASRSPTQWATISAIAPTARK